MKITYNPIEYPTSYFDDLECGDIFRYRDEGYFMRVRTRGDISRTNAVCLDDYSLVYFDDDDQVTPVNATLDIEGEEP